MIDVCHILQILENPEMTRMLSFCFSLIQSNHDCFPDFANFGKSGDDRNVQMPTREVAQQGMR